MRDTETSHFWAGTFSTPERFGSYFVETPSDQRGDDDPISPFAADQNEWFYDHDMLEYGYSDDAKSLHELVAEYSYSDQWEDEFTKRVTELKIKNVNAFIFISKSEIKNPVSCRGRGYSLTYLGTIKYKIDY